MTKSLRERADEAEAILLAGKPTDMSDESWDLLSARCHLRIACRDLVVLARTATDKRVRSRALHFAAFLVGSYDANDNESWMLRLP